MSCVHQQVNTLPDNAFHLITLGRIALVGPDGLEDESLRKRRRKLALLVVLTLTGRPLTRDLLTEMFWGDQDEERARHSLSDALSHLRRVLGRDAIAARQSEVFLSPEAALSADAIQVTTAAAAGDAAGVVAAYTGPFLDGVYVNGSANFEQWVARERDRLERLFHKACEARCLSLARSRQWDECAALATRWLSSAPLSADAALYLLNALKAPGTREADARALGEYQRIAARLRDEYELAVDQRVSALAEGIVARLHEQGAGPAAERAARTTPPIAAVATLQVVADGAGTESAVSPPVASQAVVAPAAAMPVVAAPLVATPIAPSGSTSEPRGALRHWRQITAAGVVVAALLVGGRAIRLATAQPAASPEPLVAVTSMQIVHGDSASAWLRSGLMQMISSDIARGEGVQVISPDRVRAELAHSVPANAAPSPDQALEIGRRLGANWVVTGGLSHGDTMYVLDVTVHSASTGKVLGLYTVTAGNLLALSDAAASRILSVTSNVEDAGPRLAGVNTRSTDAYEHYLHAVQAEGEGRYVDARRELDEAISLDSGFVSALEMRLASAGPPTDARNLPLLATAYRRFSDRASDWDRQERAVSTALHDGERTRAEQLARELVARYPKDPRSYATLAGLYVGWGEWDAADTVFERVLALDSLAADVGAGPCAPCVGYGGLISVHVITGDLAEAERIAHRWVELQPDLPAAWSALSFVLQTSGQHAAAITAAHHAAALGGNDPVYAERIARLLIVNHRYAAADSMLAPWYDGPSAELRESALDLRAMLERERGEFRASNRTIDALVARFPDAAVLRLVRGTSMGALGDYVGAARLFEQEAHRSVDATWMIIPPLTGDWARAFSWTHALEADAIAGSGDTVKLHVLADSIEGISARSYYSRDWRLSHHVRGLIDMRGGRYEDAIREFEQARWGASGWTATLRELARAELALGRPAQAIAYLRHAYEAPLDAMGRYVPRTEIDLLMAVSFQRAGMADSSAVYARYVRDAWRMADPEVKEQLAQLEQPAH